MTQITSGRGPQGSGPVAFSTVGLPEAQRVDLWESHNADQLIGLRCRTLAATALEATEINVRLDRVQLARVRGSSHVVERDAAMVRQRPAESVALFFTLVGEAFYYHDDGVLTLQPGQLLLCDADRPFLRGFSRGLEELVLKIPRDVFAEVTGVDHVPSPVVVGFGAGHSSFAHTLARHVGAAARATDPDPAEERTLLELVAALTGRRPDDDLGAAHLAAARTYVERHLADPSLTAARVADAVGLSTRHLSRVFGATGTSVPRYVLTRRLEAARRLLESPAGATTSVAEVARRCGFTSAAHFSHAFTTHFGERAGDVRRQAAAARAVPLA